MLNCNEFQPQKWKSQDLFFRPFCVLFCGLLAILVYNSSNNAFFFLPGMILGPWICFKVIKRIFTSFKQWIFKTIVTTFLRFHLNIEFPKLTFITSFIPRVLVEFWLTYPKKRRSWTGQRLVQIDKKQSFPWFLSTRQIEEKRCTQVWRRSFAWRWSLVLRIQQDVIIRFFFFYFIFLSS